MNGRDPVLLIIIQRIIAVVFVCALVVALLPQQTAARPRPSGQSVTKPGISFRDFSSVNYLTAPEIVRELGVGWTRQGFYWGNIEPSKGHWDWAATDRFITVAHSEGVDVLPLLAYTAPWATGANGNKFSAPRRIEGWEEFVKHVVARYSAPPFNLRYFQIWNEPTRKAGFWTGTDHEFVDKVYLPAAEIIRQHGCFVVFGGWPATNSIQEFDSVLKYHDAWRWTDILDVHYESLPYFKYLYDHWMKTGKCKGIWETELGFSDDPDFIPSVYLPILHWALEHGWNEPNQYKLFWYAAWGAGPDGPRCLSQTDAKGQVVPSDQGKRLAVLYQLLGGDPLGVFSDYEITPLPSQASVMGFRSGHRIVIAMLFDRSLLANARFILVRVHSAQKPKNVDLINEDGARSRFTARFHNGFVTVKIPLQPLAQGPGKMAIFYLQVDPADLEN